MTDWIDELDSDQDDKQRESMIISKLYKTWHYKQFGIESAWYWLEGVLDEHAYTDEHSGPLSATDSKNLTKKRSERDD